MKNILMNTEMAKAIVEGRKTQTRRVIKDNLDSVELILKKDYSMECFIKKHSKFQKDEVIWVREPAKISQVFFNNNHKMAMKYKFLSDGQEFNMEVPERFRHTKEELGETIVAYPKWLKNNRGIPNGCIKEMARIFIKITDVRVEKIQDISDSDMLKEGIKSSYTKSKHDDIQSWNKKATISLRYNFINLWNKTAPNGYKWDDNPFVFVYDFEVVSK